MEASTKPLNKEQRKIYRTPSIRYIGCSAMFFAFYALLVQSGSAADLITKNGKIYQEYEISDVTPRGLAISYKDGAATIPFSILPDDIRAKYKTDEERFTKNKQQQRIQKALNARKRPIVLEPRQKIQGAYLCTWSRWSTYIDNYKKAYSEAPASLKREFHNAEYLDAKRKNRSHDEKQQEYEQNFSKMAGNSMHPRLLDGLAFNAAVDDDLNKKKWLSRVQEWFDESHPYPQTKMIIVFGLPPETLTNVDNTAIIFKTGTFSYQGTVIERYTVNQKEILKNIEIHQNKR